MGEKEFRHDSVIGYDVERNGNSLHIKSVYSTPREVDYSNENELKRLATKANNTANGLYELIIKNCNIENPDIAVEAHLEMYLSLAGLTCEIYLKSLIYYDCLNEGKQIRDHDLGRLFSKISSDKKAIIRSRINNIDELFPDLSKLFPKIRYDYEYNHIRGEYLAVFDFMNELKVLSNSNPAVSTGAMRYANHNLKL